MKYVYVLLLVIGFFLLSKFVCGFFYGLLDTNMYNDAIMFNFGYIYCCVLVFMGYIKKQKD